MIKENGNTFQIVPEQAFNYLRRYVYSHVYRNLVLLDRVESGNQADAMVADDHNPRRKIDYGNLNLPVNHDLCLRLTHTTHSGLQQLMK